jgi:hypothetical protein
MQMIVAQRTNAIACAEERRSKISSEKKVWMVLMGFVTKYLAGLPRDFSFSQNFFREERAEGTTTAMASF